MADFIVTVAEDIANGDTSAGDLSLREAIDLANARDGADTIRFAAGVRTVTLLDDLPTITDDLTIRGRHSTTIDANADGDGDAATWGSYPRQADRRGLDIDGAGSVIINGLTITGGDTSGSGGGIRASNVESLAVTGSTIVGSRADRGAALSATGAATLLITDSIVSSNDSGYHSLYYSYSPAIYTDGAITLKRSEVSNNSAESYSGGGIAARGDVTVIDSSIESNTAFVGYGGSRAPAYFPVDTYFCQVRASGNQAGEGYHGGSSGGGISAASVTMTTSAITNNSAGFGGGVSADHVRISRSEISGNTASHYGGPSYGGGIRADVVAITDSTIANNVAAFGYGGGIWARTARITHSTVTGNTGSEGYQYQYGGTSRGGGIEASSVTTVNSLVLGNFNGSAYGNDISGTIHTDGVSIIGGDGRKVFADTTEISPGVFAGDLGKNGGPTRTVALLTGGRAIGAADPATATPNDQRGIARDHAPDLGAFEHRGRPLTITGGPAGETLFGEDSGDLLHGQGGNDRLFSYAGDDRLFGDAGNDRLFGGGGQDRLLGNGGRDALFGDAGNDWLSGGFGRDFLSGQDGRDLLFGRDGNDRMFGGRGDDRLFGGEGRDAVFGCAGDDSLSGGGGADRLAGRSGRDRLDGNAGPDTLRGGLGRDILHGGAGDDHFVFGSAAEAGRGANRDVIQDFRHGHDKIDISAVHVSYGPGDKAFTFIGIAAFSGHGYEVRYSNGEIQAAFYGVLSFQIEIANDSVITANDFIL